MESFGRHIEQPLDLVWGKRHQTAWLFLAVPGSECSNLSMGRDGMGTLNEPLLTAPFCGANNKTLLPKWRVESD